MVTRLFLTLAAIVLTGLLNAQILITEVVDGTQALSYPRYVEITNEGSSSFNIQNYKIKIFLNGSTTTNTYTFPSYIIPAGASLVITNIDNSSTDQHWTDYNLIAPDYCIYSQTLAIMGNGNDCYQLLNASDAVIDVYGISNVNGLGQPWEYTDGYAYRNLSITAPNSTFTLSEWYISPIDILDGQGSNLAPFLTPGYRALSSENDILTFTFPEQTGPATINTTLHRVDIEVTALANLASLTPTITVSPSATINPLSGEAHNFSVSPVVFTVTAQDASTQDWNVYVTQASGVNTETDILSFSIPGQLSPAVINTTNHTVSLVMPYGTNLNPLTPAITVSTGASVTPLSGSPQNFSSPVTYTVTAEDNVTVQNWIVTVTTDFNTENDILSFSFPQQTGAATINTTNHTVGIEVQYGTSLLSLTPAITVSNGATISPLSGTAQDFSAPFTYTVTAQDGTPQAWIVTVTVAAALNNETDILAFVLSEQTGPAIINTSNHTVNIEVNSGTNVTALIPSITVSAGASVTPQSGISQNFTNPVIYLVIAENGTDSQYWTVTVTVEQQPLLSVIPSTLSGFTYLVGSGPSVSQSYEISGVNLTGYPGNITITSPAHYEVSADNSSFSSALNIPYASDVLASTTVYVRLKTGLAINTYNSEIITNTGGGATTVNVTCNGHVTILYPVLTTDVSDLSGFTYFEGSGPSASQFYNLSGSNLSDYPGEITISAPSDFEVSIDNNTFFPSVNIYYLSEILTNTPIYVRLKSGLTVGFFYSEMISNIGSGTSVDVTCNGEVKENSISCAGDLFISEYHEPSAGNNKGVEIYNGTGADVNLSNYYIGVISNGGTDVETSIALSGTLGDKQTACIYNDTDADPNFRLKGDINIPWGGATWNGDDAVYLLKGGATAAFIIDAIGDLPPVTDPGTEFVSNGVSTLNTCLIRKDTVFSPSTTWLGSDWIVVTAGSYSNWGVHTIDCPTNINTNNFLSVIELYPNPNNGSFSITLQENSEITHIRIINVFGAVVYEDKRTESSYNLDLEPGVYIFQMQGNKEKITKKFVVY